MNNFKFLLNHQKKKNLQILPLLKLWHDLIFAHSLILHYYNNFENYA